MLNRWIGIASGLLMVAANVAIFWRDVLPDWLAGEPPPSEALMLCPGEERCVQVGIYDAAGRCLGKSWTRSRRIGEAGIVAVKTETVLQRLDLPGGITTPPVAIKTDVTYRYNQPRIDELRFGIEGLGVPISLHGEAMPTGAFPFTWQVGERRGQLLLDSKAPAALGDVIRPFDRLPHLYVGRSWRLDLLDPLSQLLPGVDVAALGLQPVLIRVTGKQLVVHNGVPVEAFVVEGGGATAWVAPDGVVLRQEVSLPLLGRLVLLDEPFDDQLRRKALRGVARGPAESDAALPSAQPGDESRHEHAE